MPNKPEVLLRNDDLLIPVAADVFDTSLCSNEWELLPFVTELHHRHAGMASPRQLLTLFLERFCR